MGIVIAIIFVCAFYLETEGECLDHFHPKGYCWRSRFSCLPFNESKPTMSVVFDFASSILKDREPNISQIEHSRHLSPVNFVVHLIAGLVAYSHQDKKPGLHLDERALLAA